MVRNRYLIKWAMARIICLPAIIMPYRARILYIRLLAAIIHAPLRSFGRLARFLLRKLDIRAEHLPPVPQQPPALPALERRVGSVAVLFSGGTDSMCAAALMAAEHKDVHLLTFTEHATRFSPVPSGNAAALARRFPSVRFTEASISVDALVKHLWYERYLAHLRAHGWLVLATCGFSSLSWHVRTIMYCRAHGILRVVDGLTRELMHFPGHMDSVVELFRRLYARFGIRYENPVREWPVPPDQQLIDKVLVNPHAEVVPGMPVLATTTGWYLYNTGLMPRPNMKGSAEDFSMQHECYPFALYNILVFWGFFSVEPYEVFALRATAVMHDKVEYAGQLLDGYFEGRGRLSTFI